MNEWILCSTSIWDLILYNNCLWLELSAETMFDLE